MDFIKQNKEKNEEEKINFLEYDTKYPKEVIFSFERFDNNKRIDYFFVFDPNTGKIKTEKIKTDLGTSC